MSRIGKACDVIPGKTPAKIAYTSVGDIKVVKFRDVLESGSVDYTNDEEGWFDSRYADESDLVDLCPGTILLTNAAHSTEHIGKKVAFVETAPSIAKRVCYVGELTGIRSNDPEYSTKWIYYWLQTFDAKRAIIRAVEGAHLIPREFKRIDLPAVSSAQQAAHLKILACVDDAIVKAKAELEAARELKRSLTATLLTPSTNERWQHTTFASLVKEKIRNGYSPACPQDPTGAWVLSLAALTDEGFNPDGIKPAPVGNEGLLPFRLEVDDILVSRSNTPELVGRAGRYVGHPKIAYYPDLMMRIRANHDLVSPAFAELLLRSLKARRWLKSRASGTSGSMVKIKRRDIISLPVLLPSPPRQAEIVSTISTEHEALIAVENKLASLQEVKKSLLQNLLTGKIRIPEGVLNG